MADKPSVVFVPGLWHTGATFDEVRSVLHTRGHTTHAVDLPSTGANGTRRLSDDAYAVRAVVAPLVEKGEKVIVVVHSYGALPGAQGVQDLSFNQRGAQGGKGGIIMLVYMSAFVTPAGDSLKHTMGGSWPAWVNIDGDFVRPVDPVPLMYSDLHPEAQRKAVDALVHQSFSVSLDRVTYEPWNDMETMFLFCDNDQLLPLATQEKLAALLGPNAVTFHSQGAHAAFISFPEEIADGVEYAARIGLERS